MNGSGHIGFLNGVHPCVTAAQGDELRMLARMLNAPLALDITIRFSGDAAELTLGGVGPEGKTCILNKKS